MRSYIAPFPNFFLLGRIHHFAKRMNGKDSTPQTEVLSGGFNAAQRLLDSCRLHNSRWVSQRWVPHPQNLGCNQFATGTGKSMIQLLISAMPFQTNQFRQSSRAGALVQWCTSWYHVTEFEIFTSLGFCTIPKRSQKQRTWTKPCGSFL